MLCGADTRAQETVAVGGVSRNVVVWVFGSSGRLSRPNYLPITHAQGVVCIHRLSHIDYATTIVVGFHVTTTYNTNDTGGVLPLQSSMCL